MSQVSVQLPTSTFLRLAAFLRERDGARDPVSAVNDAVNYWLDNAEWKTEDLLPDAVQSHTRGYTWKIQKTEDSPSAALFLPARTSLRIKKGSIFEYAAVDGDALVYRGEQVSPNQFAKLATGSARDAWRDVWVKRPGDQDYQNADALRQARLNS